MTPAAPSRAASVPNRRFSPPYTLSHTVACARSDVVTTPVTVTKPMRGSFSVGIVSETTALIASSTRRMRGDRVVCLVIERHQIALVGEQLELLTCQPALSGVEELVGLSGLARDAGEREPRALPDVMMVDLRDRAGHAVR